MYIKNMKPEDHENDDRPGNNTRLGSLRSEGGEETIRVLNIGESSIETRDEVLNPRARREGLSKKLLAGSDENSKQIMENIESLLTKTPVICAESYREYHDAEPNIYESGINTCIETVHLKKYEGEDIPENLMLMSYDKSDEENNAVITHSTSISSSEIYVDTTNYKTNEDGNSSEISLEWSPFDSDDEQELLYISIETSTTSCIRTLRCDDNGEQNRAEEKEFNDERIYKTSTIACIKRLTHEKQPFIFRWVAPDDEEVTIDTQSLYGGSTESCKENMKLDDYKDDYPETNMRLGCQRSDDREETIGSLNLGQHIIVPCEKVLNPKDRKDLSEKLLVQKNENSEEEMEAIERLLTKTPVMCAESNSEHLNAEPNLYESDTNTYMEIFNSEKCEQEDWPKNLLSIKSHKSNGENETATIHNIFSSSSELFVNTMNSPTNENRNSTETSPEWSPLNSDDEKENFGLHISIETSTKSCIRILRYENNEKEDVAGKLVLIRKFDGSDDNQESIEKRFHRTRNEACIESLSPEDNGENDCPERFFVRSVKKKIDEDTLSTHTNLATSAESSLKNNVPGYYEECLPCEYEDDQGNIDKHIRSRTGTECNRVNIKREDNKKHDFPEIYEELGYQCRHGGNETIGTPNIGENNSEHCQKTLKDEMVTIERVLREKPVTCSVFSSERKFNGTSTKQCIKILKLKHETQKLKDKTPKPKVETLKPEVETVKPNPDKLKTVIERWYAGRSVDRSEKDKENVQVLWIERHDGYFKCCVDNNCTFISKERDDLIMHMRDHESIKNCTLS